MFFMGIAFKNANQIINQYEWLTNWMLFKPCCLFHKQTVKVQGNDISHKLQIARVSKSDEGLYECRVTDANYGELKEYKVQAYLKVNATVRRGLIKKTSPLHLTNKKPRKSSSALGQDSNGMNSDQHSQSSSTSQASQSKTVKHSAGSGKSGSWQSFCIHYIIFLLLFIYI